MYLQAQAEGRGVWGASSPQRGGRLGPESAAILSLKFLDLSVLLLFQFGDKALQDGHLKLDILRHLVDHRGKTGRTAGP